MRKALIRAAFVLSVLLIFPLAAGAEQLVSSFWNTGNAASADERQTATPAFIAGETAATPASNQKSTELTDADKTRRIVSSAVAYADSEMSDEALKALLAICKNNFEYSQNNDKTASGENQNNADNADDSLTDRLYEMLKSVDIALSYGGRCVYIPLTKLSDGNTATSDEYTYFQSVASPWDVFSDEYDPNAEYRCGVSVYGLQVMCDSSDSKTALKWFLPGFEVI